MSLAEAKVKQLIGRTIPDADDVAATQRVLLIELSGDFYCLINNDDAGSTTCQVESELASKENIICARSLVF